jgi:hypothetical protein
VACGQRDSIGADLTHVRLVHRERRLIGALDALGRRAREQESRGGAPVPEGLRRAIADFAAELATVRAARRALEAMPLPGARTPVQAL